MKPSPHQFSALVNHPFYVDKTGLIEELEDNSSHIHLFLQPDGSMKTANYEMLKAFYGNSDEAGSFAGLAISHNDAFMREQGAHHVIALDFTKFTFKTMPEAIAQYREMMSVVYKQFEAVIMASDALLDYEKEKFIKIKDNSLEINTSQIQRSICYLLEFLFKTTDRTCVVLVEGVDIPFELASMNNFFKDLNSFMTICFVSWCKNTEYSHYFHRAVLFGRTRVMEPDTFSGLNNIEVDSFLQNRSKYQTYFGFTPTEAQKLLEENGLENFSLQAVNAYAGGYQSRMRFVLNPMLFYHFLEMGEKKPIDEFARTYLTGALNKKSITIDRIMAILTQAPGNLTSFFTTATPGLGCDNELKHVLSHLIYFGIISILPEHQDRAHSHRKYLVIPNLAMHQFIDTFIFQNPAFNPENIPCPPFVNFSQAHFDELDAILSLLTVEETYLKGLKKFEAFDLPYITEPITIMLANILLAHDVFTRTKAKIILEKYHSIETPYVAEKLNQQKEMLNPLLSGNRLTLFSSDSSPTNQQNNVVVVNSAENMKPPLS